MDKVSDIRCGQCQRKLCVGIYISLDIKCPRCGALNLLRASAADHSSPSPTLERPERHQKRTRDDS
jgi:phage FluMu protein Com